MMASGTIPIQRPLVRIIGLSRGIDVLVGMVAQVLLRSRRSLVLAIVRNRSVGPLQREDAQDENGEETTHGKRF